MTIRIEHLIIEDDDRSWLHDPKDGEDVTYDETHRLNLLSIVRHILRDEPCTIVPVVRKAVAHPTNEYGHNMQVEVTYSRNGWRAIYAAHVGDRVTNVQCYMD